MEAEEIDDCPCGSGRKFMDCHGKYDSDDEIESDEFEVNPEAIKDFIENFDKAQLLAISAALQLCIENYGKNIRLEDFTDEVLRSGVASDQVAAFEDIQEFFDKHLRFDSMEDPTVSHFVENVAFFGGNYRVLPGINTDSTEVINGFLQAIFTVSNNLTAKFKEQVRKAAHLLLLISEIMVNQTGLERYAVEEEGDDPIFVPELEAFNKLLSAVRFEKGYLEKMCADWEIPVETISLFLINDKDLGEEHDPYESPLFSYPLYDNDEEIICLVPATIMKALADYIKRLSTEMDEEQALLEAYHSWQWHKILQYANEMGWSETDIELPEAISPERFMEGVFRIDQDKLAYVQLIKGSIKPEPTMVFIKPDEPKEKRETANERNEVVTAYLKSLKEKHSNKVFTLFIAGGMGGHMMFAWPKPESGNQTLFFSFGDFQKVIFEGDLEPLSLWKFAKAYGRAAESTRFMPGATSLDLYVLYLENEGSMLPRDASPDVFSFMGVGTDFQRRVIAFRDEHAARRYVGNKPSDIPVRRKSKYAPIYRLQDVHRENIRLIESYVFPCWIVSTQARNRDEHTQISLYTEAVAFWMLKLTNILAEKLNTLGSKPVEIRLELDRLLFTNTTIAEWPEGFAAEAFDFFVEERIIRIELPATLIRSLAEDDNQGERAIMRTALRGFNVLLKKYKQATLSDEEIEIVIEDVMSPGNAKMILIGNSDDNPLLDNRGVGFQRHIYAADQALVDDYLIPNLKLKESLPENIIDPVEKNKLCLTIVDSLITQIREKIAVFNLYDLIRWLITLNESLLHEDAENDLRMPHQLACFSDFPTAVADLQRKNSQIIPTSLACRCLIEFVAAEPPSGTQPINLDEMDELVALMNEVIHYANIADSIDLKLNDPEMGLMPSGRLFVSQDFFKKYLHPFNLARVESEIYAMLQNEERSKPEDDDGSILVNNATTDKAFFEEWAVTLTTLTAIYGNLIKMGMVAGESFMIMPEEKFIQEIQKDFVKPVSEEELLKGLQMLTLEKRERLDKAPEGFTSKDIMPWRFNRALSYNRRPLVKITHPDNGQTFYHWGFRQVLRSYHNLTNLITGGRLVVKKKGPIEKEVLTIFRHRKGKRYRKQVFTWLKAKTKLEVIDYEVTIHEKGILVADRNYGDVDVMAFDHDNKVIYAIECKNTGTARAIHEMKTELDDYIGQDGNSGHILQHLNRDTWLKANKGQLVKFIKDPEQYEIRSIVLTSNVIPVLYLAKNKSALPIFSFPDLVRKGFEMIAGH